ncbi:MAG: alpha/beta hydrolase [Polyangiaceae bacterium]
MPLRAALKALRVKSGQVLMDGTWKALAQTGRLPAAQPERHGVERIRDVAYDESGQRDHTLDVYRPIRRAGPLPAVLYLHGGGFRVLSKDTHWIMSLAFARKGYVVFTINYRLAPAHPFPAAMEDSSAALLWVKAHAARFGGDPSRIVLAGESAGANLATSLAITTSYRRPEPWAARVFDSELRPVAVLPACGMLQVSNVERFTPMVSTFVRDRLREIEDSYGPVGPSRDLADPLVMLERGEAPARPLPPFFAGVGTRDVLKADTRRLKAALDRLGVRCDVRYYPGEVHAFHALVWRANAKAFWRDTHRFLEEHAPPLPG